MVTFDDRLGYLILGCALGYVIRILQDKFAPPKRDRNERGERGFMRIPVLADAAMLIALSLCVFASVKTGSTNQHLTETQAKLVQTQDRLAQVASCNRLYLQAQADFLAVYFEVPPASNAEQLEALQKYYTILNEFAQTDLGKKETKSSADAKELADCIMKEVPPHG